MKKRCELILELLTTEEKVEVTNLSEILKVSKVTVRKDLDELVDRGLVKREHGYAVLSSYDDLNYRLALNYEHKQQIAKIAAKTIKNGETIMIESGSCCALLANEVVQTKQDVTIVTNSTFIAQYVRSHPGARIILLGGEYQRDSQVSIGPLTRENVKSYFLNKLFVGIDGFRANYGFTAGDMMRADVVHAMTNQVDTVNLLTESAKFECQGVVPLLPFNAVTSIYTDAHISEKDENFFTNKGIEVVKATID